MAKLGFFKKAKLNFDSAGTLNFQLRMFYCILNNYLECCLPIFEKKNQKIPIISMLNLRLKCAGFYDMGIMIDFR